MTSHSCCSSLELVYSGLFFRSKSLGPAHTQGRGSHRRESQEVGPWESSQKAAHHRRPLSTDLGKSTADAGNSECKDQDLFKGQ